MNLPASNIPKTDTERILKRNIAMKTAGIDQQKANQGQDWLGMLGDFLPQAKQQLSQTTPPPQKLEAPKQDLLGSISSGLEGILKYASTPEGRQIVSGFMGDPYAAGAMATQAQQDIQSEREAAQRQKEKMFDVISGLGAQQYRGQQVQEQAQQEQAARQKELDQKIAAQSEEEERKRIQREQEQQFKREEAERQRTFTREEADKNRKIEREKLEVTIQKAKDNAKKDAQGRDLPANEATDLGDQQGSLDMLDKMMSKAGSIKGLSYTPADKLTAIANPWAAGVQTFNQLVATTKQVIGKGLEGGVLRKEDEEKYEKIIPKLGDTKDVLEGKANQLRALLVNKRNNTLSSLSSAGFDVSKFKPTQEKTYDVFGRKKKQGVTFNTPEEAESAGLPPGTEVIIGGRRAVIE